MAGPDQLPKLWQETRAAEKLWQETTRTAAAKLWLETSAAVKLWLETTAAAKTLAGDQSSCKTLAGDQRPEQLKNSVRRPEQLQNSGRRPEQLQKLWQETRAAAKLWQETRAAAKLWQETSSRAAGSLVWFSLISFVFNKCLRRLLSRVHGVCLPNPQSWMFLQRLSNNNGELALLKCLRISLFLSFGFKQFKTRVTVIPKLSIARIKQRTPRLACGASVIELLHSFQTEMAYTGQLLSSRPNMLAWEPDCFQGLHRPAPQLQAQHASLGARLFPGPTRASSSAPGPTC
ncbi:hypothetical protein Bbelb_167540 [Branchiostoma belcheri]|nr:hypothetical protein Bbelb_167540 [Branchiostoma belcheri]